MAVQTTYNETMDAARAGQIVNTEHKELISRTVEDAAGFGFGIPVAQGSNDKGATATLTGVSEIVGITVRERSTNPATPDKRGQYESTLLMRKGVIWVVVTDAGGVDAGDLVWINLTNGTFSNADVGSSNGLQLSGCRWETSAANGALAQLRVNLDV
ncbi:hypothetical protein [Roseibium alexandrii]|uniref:structural cement protein Gp24 n=1 Tax=Roseibium alexandrii TaxID=388408 RepID=UPI0037538B9C